MLCGVFNIINHFHVKDILDILAAVFGLIVGQKLQGTVRVSVTALLGATYMVTGSFICFKSWPLEPGYYALYYLEISLIAIFTMVGCWYQTK